MALLEQEVVPLEGAKDWRLPENRREAFLDFYEMEHS